MAERQRGLSAEFEARLRAVEAAGTTDFDRGSWWWLVGLGLLLPIALIAGGWWFGPGAP